MSDFATIADVQELKRSLTASEMERARHLIPVISSVIRFEAKKTGRDFDLMITESELCLSVDEFTGDGEQTAFVCAYSISEVQSVTVDGADVPSDAYTVGERAVTFNEAPTGAVAITYSYRALSDVARGVVCDVIIRELNTPGSMLPTTSYSESAGSVSQSYSLPNSSGSIKLWPSDLKALGLKRQKLDAIDMWTRKRR